MTGLAQLLENQGTLLLELVDEMIALAQAMDDWIKQPAIRKVLSERQLAIATEHHLLHTLWNVGLTVVIHHRCLLLLRDTTSGPVTIITPDQVCLCWPALSRACAERGRQGALT